MTPPTVLQVTFSGSEVVPLKYRGRDLVVEDDCVTLDGHILARWRERRWVVDQTDQSDAYDRFAVGWIEAWPDIQAPDRSV